MEKLEKGEKREEGEKKGETRKKWKMLKKKLGKGKKGRGKKNKKNKGTTMENKGETKGKHWENDNIIVMLVDRALVQRVCKCSRRRVDKGLRPRLEMLSRPEWGCH